MYHKEKKEKVNIMKSVLWRYVVKVFNFTSLKRLREEKRFKKDIEKLLTIGLKDTVNRIDDFTAARIIQLADQLLIKRNKDK